MPTVSIGSVNYDAYADLDTANTYLAAATQAKKWNLSSTTDDTKGQALVTATRLLNRQKWQGTKTDSYGVDAFPRTGLVDNEGEGVDPDTVPIQVIEATIELANYLVQGKDLQDQKSTARQTKSLKAGSVNIEYFRGAEGLPTRFPQIVQELLGMWLAGSGTGISGFQSFGTDELSQNDGDEFMRTGGL